MKETPPSEGVEIPMSPCATARSVAAASAAALAAIAASPPGAPAHRGSMDAGGVALMRAAMAPSSYSAPPQTWVICITHFSY